MLGDYPIDVVLLAPDLESAKDFYANKIGLEILDDSPYGVHSNAAAARVSASARAQSEPRIRRPRPPGG